MTNATVLEAIPAPPVANDLDPEVRAFEGVVGTPVVLGDGKTWLLASGWSRPEIGPSRDRIFDRSALDGQVLMVDIQEAAWWMLRANHDMTDVEAVLLVAGADQDALILAVEAAMFGLAAPRRTYTEWAMTALLANGLDPDMIPAALVDGVLEQLVLSGRCARRDQFISSAAAAADPEYQKIRHRAARSAAVKAKAEAAVEARSAPAAEAPE